MDLNNILKFVKLTHAFQKVERVCLVPGEERWENDVEHSYQLAMLAWYIASSEQLSLNRDLLLQYGLIHDLVEVYAGDTYIFDKDPSVIASKKQREQESLERLSGEFPEFPELIHAIRNYELQVDEESKFIYALDKIIPPLNMYLDGGRTWQRMQISLEQIVDHKKDKVKAHPHIEKYFEIIVRVLTNERAALWDKQDEKI